MLKKYKEDVLKKAKFYEKDLFKFLTEIIHIPSTSTNERAVVNRIEKEMQKLGYEEIIIDDMGNILGRMGNGNKVMAYDGHIDTVDIGLLKNWNVPPLGPFEDEVYIYGRGASDQKGGFASALYGVKIMKDLNLMEDYTIWVVGSIQEEDCDGLCWQHILKNKIIEPEFVVLTEPTSLGVYRGQRGRMEIKIAVEGVSAHGSAPERGDNAIYKMAKILNELEILNDKLKCHEFLGKGSLTVSEIFFSSPSRCAVADGCIVSVDRRLTLGETHETALKEIKDLKTVRKFNATVEMYEYKKKSYKNFSTKSKCYFPTWLIEENHKLCKTFTSAYEYLFDSNTILDKWTFSTNGVSIKGMYNVDCIGFGPGAEKEAHAPNEKIKKEELVKAMQLYALILKAHEGGL